MVGKRKRAPGGGRKPKGEPTTPLSLRIPAELRRHLKQAADAKGKSVSEELIWRIHGSFGRERDKESDPELRALCFVIAKLSRDAVGFWDVDGTPQFSWRSDPFFFRAFKIAVARVLDALDPGGVAQPPKIEKTADEGRSLRRPEFFMSFRSPKERGEYAAKIRLALLHEAEANPDLEWLKVHPEIWTQVTDELYGMYDARRALQNEGDKS